MPLVSTLIHIDCETIDKCAKKQSDRHLLTRNKNMSSTISEVGHFGVARKGV